MPYTVTECADFVKLTLGGEPSAVLPTLALVNMAGHHFVSMSKWRFQERRASYLSTVASQTYIAAPTDLGGIVSLAPVNSAGCYKPSTIDEINMLRSSASTDTGTPYLYALIHTTPSGSTAAVPYLELYPTPSTSTANALQIVYRARWVELTSDSDYIPFPDFTKTLFIRVLQAHARGFMEEDKASLSARLLELSASPEFVACVKQDRAMQSDRGEMKGDISGGYASYSEPFFDTITGP
jgi:hypothetical protein